MASGEAGRLGIGEANVFCFLLQFAPPPCRATVAVLYMQYARDDIARMHEICSVLVVATSSLVQEGMAMGDGMQWKEKNIRSRTGGRIKIPCPELPALPAITPGLQTESTKQADRLSLTG